jgi:glycosyltransferase involved in cell wall biosynthesis
VNPPDWIYRLCPWQFRSAARALLELPARREFARSLNAIPHRPATDGAVVLHLGDPDGPLVHGGRVKTLHLRAAFPVDPARCNVLYLVSSSPPRFGDLLVRWARARGVRFVWNQNGVGYRAWAGPDYAQVNRPMRSLLRAADHVLYQSRFCRDSADRFLGPTTAPGEILPNPVDLAVFRPATPSASPNDRSPRRLLTIGTHASADRVLGPLRALRLLRDAGVPARLTIAGPLAWKEADREVADAIASAGVGQDAVRLLPAFAQSEAPDLYRSHDLLIHPKTMDPCPTVVLEALACGLPVIGSATGGMPELVTAECGVLIDTPCDYDRHTPLPPEQIASAVRRLAGDLPACSARARRRAEEHFGLEPWMRRHREVFEQLVAEGGSR